MLNLIVKGNRHAAAVAAANRAIPFAFAREVRAAGVQTVGVVGEQHADKVVRWFAHLDTQPFPDGTLLLYHTV